MIVSPASDPEVRATGLGGSDIARILGLSRFGGPMEVWMEKRRLAAPLLESEAMRWGKLLEDPIAREYAVKTGRRVTRVNRTLRHPQHSFLFAHLDRRAKGPGEPARVLECKNANQFMVSDFGQPGSDEVPDDYMLQCQHYLNVTGLEVADLAVLIGGQKHLVFEIPRDPELIEQSTREAVRFWHEHVETGVPPDVDGSEAWREYAESRFVDAGVKIEATDELLTLAYQYQGLGATIKKGEEMKREVRTRILEAMGDAARAEAEGVKITHSVVHRRDPDYKAILAAQKVPPAVVDEFTREGIEHRVTITIKAA